MNGKRCVISHPISRFSVTLRPEGVSGLVLGELDLQGIEGSGGVGVEGDEMLGEKERVHLHVLTDELTRYLDGEKVLFKVKIDLAGYTPFQRRVYEAARQIPYGETRSYAWVAERCGSPRGYRAVGQALKNNPLAIVVPCHRVIASDGGIGGFSGGLDWKRRLLTREKQK